MNTQPYCQPPRRWSPKLSPSWIRVWRRFRRRDQFVAQRLLKVEVRNLEVLHKAVKQGSGVLITPNHSTHADCHTLYSASEALGKPFYVMAGWQVFSRGSRLRQLVLQHHGCFSVDREGADLSAVRQARDILVAADAPLAIFPEGEVYHVNDRVMPFREGPAAIALMAAKKAEQPIVCVPCAMKYRYLRDPTPELLELMARLEEQMTWRPRPDLTLPERIYHLAEGKLALKEIEHMGQTQAGSLPERIHGLIEFVLGRVENSLGLDPVGTTIPERVKGIRRAAIEGLADLAPDDSARRPFEEALDDAFFVVQAFSYPGNYVAEDPTIERIAETLDKFEEDILGCGTATIRGTRKATITFGDPFPVENGKDSRMVPAELTRLLERQVQGLLDAGDGGVGANQQGGKSTGEVWGNKQSSSSTRWNLNP